MGSIKNVLSEPIEGHEDYHVLVRQMFLFWSAYLFLVQAGLIPWPKK